MTPHQVRMARAALGWSVDELAAAAGIAPNTVTHFELGRSCRAATLRQLRETLEAAGIRFHTSETEIGVALTMVE